MLTFAHTKPRRPSGWRKTRRCPRKYSLPSHEHCLSFWFTSAPSCRMQKLRDLGLMGPMSKGTSSMYSSAGDDHALKGPARLTASSLWAAPSSGLPSAATRAQLLAQEAMVGCEICGDDDDESDNQLLLCDAAGCNRGYHQKCLQPALESVPRRRWLCPECVIASGSQEAKDAVGVIESGLTSQPVVEVSAASSTQTRTPGNGMTPTLRAQSLPVCTSCRGSSSDSEQASPAALRSAREWCAHRRGLLRRAREALHLATAPSALLCREVQVCSVLWFGDSVC